MEIKAFLQDTDYSLSTIDNALWDNRWQNFSRPVVAQFSRPMASFSREDLKHMESRKKLKKVSHGARKDILRCPYFALIKCDTFPRILYKCGYCLRCIYKQKPAR